MMTTPKPIQASVLREWVLSTKTSDPTPDVPSHFKIIDVRDDDFRGGKIPGSVNVPSRQLPLRIDALADELKDLDAVVFTCALSQQRGPNVWRPGGGVLM
jgi:Rhodanese-like domain